MRRVAISLLVSFFLIASTSFTVLAEEHDSTGTDSDAEGVICYNIVTHTITVETSESECNSFMYLENYTMDDGTDVCYNVGTHMTNLDDDATCSSYNYFENYTMGDGQDVCYNMFNHMVNEDDNNTCSSYSYLENSTMADGSSFTGCYNSVTHSADENSSQDVCEAYSYYENYGATVFTGCYNTASHWMDANLSSDECTSFSYYLNYGATVYTGCYNMATHQVSNESQAVCGGYMWTEAVNLATTAGATTIHTALVEALGTANLVGTLSGEDNYTIFAPSDEAFAAAGIDLSTFDTEEEIAVLADILLYHVVAGTILSSDLAVGMTTVSAANGDDLMIHVTDSSVMVGSEMAVVTIADVPASNGVIHVIDKVLTPPSDENLTDDSEVDCDATISISSDGFAFSPASVSIEVGQTVCWSWTDAEMGHNVKEVDGFKSTKFVTGGITSGAPEVTVNFHQTFTKDTTFNYACEPHISLDMFGKVTVGDGGVKSMDSDKKDSENNTPGFLGVTMILAALGAVVYARTTDSQEQ